MKQRGFTLIEILIAMLIISILSSIGVVSYNNYTSTVKDSATKLNYNQIIKTMESEFAKCKLDNNSKIFNSHKCNSSQNPSFNTLNNYFNNMQKLKNPYDNKQQVAQSNICNKGSVSITNKATGSYEVKYASIKKKEKYTSTVSSHWSSNYTQTISTKASFTCAASSSASTATASKKESFDTYKPPDGPGAGIIVDKDGNMVKGQGAHACSADCFKVDKGGMKNWYIYINGKKVYPARSGSQYRFVMVEGPSKSGNIASSCAKGNCKYNFSNNTYTVLNSGKTYKAGVSIDTRKAINP